MVRVRAVVMVQGQSQDAGIGFGSGLGLVLGLRFRPWRGPAPLSGVPVMSATWRRGGGRRGRLWREHYRPESQDDRVRFRVRLGVGIR